MPVLTVLILGLWRTLLDTQKALESHDVNRPAQSLMALLLDLLDGVQERMPEIRKLVADLQHIGAE